MRAMQCMQFRAKSAKNDLKPTDFLKRNFYFETEGVLLTSSMHPIARWSGKNASAHISWASTVVQMQSPDLLRPYFFLNLHRTSRKYGRSKSTAPAADSHQFTQHLSISLICIYAKSDYRLVKHIQWKELEQQLQKSHFQEN